MKLIVVEVIETYFFIFREKFSPAVTRELVDETPVVGDQRDSPPPEVFQDTTDDSEAGDVCSCGGKN